MRPGRARFVYRALRARWRDERAEIRALLGLLREGDRVVDVGANKGAYTFWMRRAVGPAGRVHAFEPQPELAAYLRGACAAMGWSNVEVREAAASDHPGRATLRVPGDGGPSQGATLERAANGATLGPGAAGSTHRELSCAVERLDDALGGDGDGRIAFLKVDVEGHELAVFRGASRILERDRPAVLFECEERHLGDATTTADVFAFLERLGYSGAFFSTDGPRPLSEFDPAVHQRREPGRFWKAPGYVNNFLFTATPSGARVFER